MYDIDILGGTAVLRNQDFYQFTHFYIPTAFAEEHLVVSDGMGFVSSPSFYINRESFRNNLVMAVLEGVLHVEQYNRHYRLEAGQGILLKLTDAHQYYSDSKEVAKVFWLHFRGKPLDRLMLRLGESEQLPYCFDSVPLEPDIRALFAQVREHDEALELQVSAGVYALVLKALRAPLLHAIREMGGPGHALVSRTRTYIDDHLCEELTLEQLSAQAQINKYYLCRLFRTYLGMAPMHYVLRRKILLSQKMLENSDLTVSAIASTLHFSDQSHFSKTFKQLIGLSPSQYRDMLLGHRSDSQES